MANILTVKYNNNNIITDQSIDSGTQVIYNNSAITTLSSTGTKILSTKDKILNSNITIGSKTLLTQNKLANDNITLVVSKPSGVLYNYGTENTAVTGGHHNATTCSIPSYWRYYGPTENTDNLNFNCTSNRDSKTWIINNAVNTNDLSAVKITYTASGYSKRMSFYTISNNLDSAYYYYVLPDASSANTITVPISNFSIDTTKTWSSSMYFTIFGGCDVSTATYLTVYYIEFIYA